ncbi:MAG: hypothetical protein HY856_13415 [Burkholderiales bacterium]|nr:hypothetical protein [Burkholderiales bacterium]
MNFRDIWLRMKHDERVALAEKVGSTYLYLQKISGGFAVPSLALAQRLKGALGKRLALDGFLSEHELAGKRRPRKQ